MGGGAFPLPREFILNFEYIQKIGLIVRRVFSKFQISRCAFSKVNKRVPVFWITLWNECTSAIPFALSDSLLHNPHKNSHTLLEFFFHIKLLLRMATVVKNSHPFFEFFFHINLLLGMATVVQRGTSPSHRRFTCDTLK